MKSSLKRRAGYALRGSHSTRRRNSDLSMGIAGIETMRADVEHNYSFEAPSSDDGTIILPIFDTKRLLC
jgi:hypothetical protein